jgi:arylsulfatase A-like enzyme
MSCGVPLVIRYPKGKKGVVDELFGTVDIFPTLLDLAGGNVKNYDLDGLSTVKYLKGEDIELKKYLISEHSMVQKNISLRYQHWRMVLDNRYKVITTLDYKPFEIYDTIEDPYEMDNLIDKLWKDVRINLLIENLKDETYPIKVTIKDPQEPADS